MAKTRLRSKLALLGAAILVVPLLLVVAEVGVRLFATKLDPLAVFVASPQLRSDTQGEHTAGLFEFDPRRNWRLRANLRNAWWDFTPVTTNASHLRMNQEVGPKRGLRIVCLGDSVTFGYRVPVAHERTRPDDHDPAEKSYPTLLAELLQKRLPETPIEVLPLACPGYTSGQGATWLEETIAKLRPDLVMACFGWNDVRAAGLPDRVTFPSNDKQAAVRSWMARSQLLLHLAKSAQNAQLTSLAGLPAEPRSSAEEYVAHFTHMQSLCREHSAWFGIILPVYRDPNTPGDYPEGPSHPGEPDEAKRMGLYRDELEKAAARAEIPVLRVPELTERGWPGNAELFGERIHPNAQGHRLLAERLVDWLGPVVQSRKASP